jgi:hypothetical protein
MFWIYIPPIIFIAALVALVVVIGKKKAALKEKGVLREEATKAHSASRSERFGARLKTFWKHTLRFLEWLLQAVKFGFKKSEAGLSGLLHRMKEKRLGKKIPKTPEEDISKLEYFREEPAVSRVTKVKKVIECVEDEEIPAGKMDLSRQGVVVKKKEDPIPQRIVPEVAPEDKVRENALIHRIAENPKDIEAYREIGDYYLSVGDIKDAKDSFKMVLKLRPRDLKAKSSLREIEMRMRLGS